MAAPSVSAAIAPLIPIVLHLTGQFTASAAAIAEFRLPQGCRIVRIGASAQAKGGTHGTTTLDVTKGGTSVLSAAIDLKTAAAGAWTEGTLAKAATADVGVDAAKEAEMQVNLVVTGGTSPTIDNVTVQIDICPVQ